MNKVVLEHYPASKLPDEMRGNVDPDATVTVVVMEETSPQKRPTLEEIWARRRPPFRSKEEIDAQWRRQRDEQDD